MMRRITSNTARVLLAIGTALVAFGAILAVIVLLVVVALRGPSEDASGWLSGSTGIGPAVDRPVSRHPRADSPQSEASTDTSRSTSASSW
jgi:hypothetical protein